MKAAICWYKNMQALEKFQLMFIDQIVDIKVCIDVNTVVVQMTDRIKLLGVTTDSMVSFDQYVQSICQKNFK